MDATHTLYGSFFCTIGTKWYENDKRKKRSSRVNEKVKMSPQKRATVVSSSVATLLVIVKLILGVASGSVAVLASAIDSLLDMLVSAFNFFAIKKSEEHPDEEYHYGKG